MRKTSIMMLTVLLAACGLFAQSPHAINYQTIVRNPQGVAMPNQNIGFLVKILEGSINGTPVYQESFKQNTNDFGLVNFQIGRGQFPVGNFADINWGQHEYYLNIQADINGGSNYTDMGTQQLVSVPYALYAETAGNTYHAGQGIAISNDTINAKAADALWNANQLQGNNISSQTPQQGQVLMWNGSSWEAATLPVNNSNNSNSLIYTTRGF